MRLLLLQHVLLHLLETSLLLGLLRFVLWLLRNLVGAASVAARRRRQLVAHMSWYHFAFSLSLSLLFLFQDGRDCALSIDQPLELFTQDQDETPTICVCGGPTNQDGSCHFSIATLPTNYVIDASRWQNNQ